MVGVRGLRLKMMKYCSFQPALRPSSAEEDLIRREHTVRINILAWSSDLPGWCTSWRPRFKYWSRREFFSLIGKYISSLLFNLHYLSCAYLPTQIGLRWLAELAVIALRNIQRDHMVSCNHFNIYHYSSNTNLHFIIFYKSIPYTYI